MEASANVVVYVGMPFAGKTSNLLVLRNTSMPPLPELISIMVEDSGRVLTMMVNAESLPPGARKQAASAGAAFRLISAIGVHSKPAVIESTVRRAQGIVLVVDARRQLVLENLRAYRALIATLARGGLTLQPPPGPAASFPGALPRVPWVVQLNRHDYLDCMSEADVRELLWLPQDVPVIAANTRSGAGVHETFDAMCQRIIASSAGPGKA